MSILLSKTYKKTKKQHWDWQSGNNHARVTIIKVGNLSIRMEFDKKYNSVERINIYQYEWDNWYRI